MSSTTIPAESDYVMCTTMRGGVIHTGLAAGDLIYPTCRNTAQDTRGTQYRIVDAADITCKTCTMYRDRRNAARTGTQPPAPAAKPGRKSAAALVPGDTVKVLPVTDYTGAVSNHLLSWYGKRSDTQVKTVATNVKDTSPGARARIITYTDGTTTREPSNTRAHLIA